jgi:hypothetical protein
LFEPRLGVLAFVDDGAWSGCSAGC